MDGPTSIERARSAFEAIQNLNKTEQFSGLATASPQTRRTRSEPVGGRFCGRCRNSISTKDRNENVVRGRGVAVVERSAREANAPQTRVSLPACSITAQRASHAHGDLAEALVQGARIATITRNLRVSRSWASREANAPQTRVISKSISETNRQARNFKQKAPTTQNQGNQNRSTCQNGGADATLPFMRQPAPTANLRCCDA